HEMGRIYRITPEGTGKADWTGGLKLGDESPLDWVRHLANPNIWWRQNAQRLLVAENDKTVVPELVKLARESDSPEARLHALWTLEGMGALTPGLITASLKDKEAGVRENAVKLAELHLAGSPDLAGDLLALKDDPHPRVRFQLLCTLGFIDSPGASKAREELLFRDLEDEWVQVAALSASTLQTLPLLNTVLARYNAEIPAYGSLVRRLTAMVAAGDHLEEVEQL